MSYPADLLAVLQPLFDSRVYPDAFPLSESGGLPTWPAARYTVVGGVVSVSSCGSNSADGDDVDVQIDIVAAGAAQRDDLVAQVRAGLDAMTSPPAVITARPSTVYDPDTRTYRGVIQVTLSYSTAG